jgi:exodeoxyribonuclease-5
VNPFLECPKDFIIPGARVQRDVRPPDYSTLKPGQAAAVDGILDYLGDNTKGFRAILLKGYAGTGKTYVTSFIVEWLLTRNKVEANPQNLTGIEKLKLSTRNPNIAVTAPTNKAVKVGERMAEYTHKNIQYKTIHKLLGLKEVITDSGKVRFEKEYGQETELLSYDILFIDEVSMVNDELFDMIYHEITSKDSKTKLVMIGDGFQIPPVGSDDCKPFKEKYQEELKIGVVELTEIVRQTHGSPIISLATAVRERQEGIIESHVDCFNENGALHYLERGSKDAIYKICDNYFNNEYFQEYPDFMKVIAWRNITVNQINAKVRSLIYSNVPRYTKLMVGEKLIANTPITSHGNNRVIYTSNDEFEVVSFTIERRETYRNKDVVINCKFYNVVTKDINGNLKEICVIHEDDEAILNSISAQLKQNAIKCKDAGLRGYVWKVYFEVARHFADVKYNYAITAHKSQGSSYQNTMVLMWDILQNTKQLEAERILYVGVSRPRQNLCVIY